MKSRYIILSIIVFFVFSQTTLAAIRADVDQNGTVNTTDAMLTLRNSLGLDMSYTNWHASATTGDVNCDNSLNSTDAMLILRKSLGLDMAGTHWCEEIKDEKLIYKNNEDITVTLSATDAMVTRKNDNKVLLDTIGKDFYQDRSGGNVNITYSLEEKDGGFDVVYEVVNNTTQAQSMPDFKISGINLDDGALDILNTYKMYMEDGRQLTDDSDYAGHSDNRFAVGPYYGSYTLTGDQVNGRNYCTYDSGNDITICRYMDNRRYRGGVTNSYSPVIVAKDNDFAVGVALEYPFLDYNYDTTNYGGTLNTKKDPNFKLYPFMRIVKDGNSWIYEYAFIHYQNPEEQFDGYIPAGQTYHFTIPVRFSQPTKWLLTLYPYKNYLKTTYGESFAPQRSSQPVLWVNLAFYGIYAEQNNNPRNWSYNWQLIDDGSPVELPIEEVTAGLSNIMESHGYNDILLHGLSGLYPVTSGSSMYSEIPNQFVVGRPDYMKGGALNNALQTFTNAGQKYSFWWGISGSMPVDGNEDVLSYSQWLPDHDIPFKLNNSTHKNFATYQLNQALNLSPSGIGYDAYGRMEEKTAMQWLDEMHDIINTAGTETEIWLEEMSDIKHKKAGIIRQGYTDWREIQHNAISKPPVLAQYLNPQAKIIVLLENHAMNELSEITPEQHIQSLIKMGYTPFVLNKSSLNNNQAYTNLTDKIIGNSDSFYDLSSLDKTIYTCFDSIDNDNDGKIDWPYEDSCSSATTNEE